MVPKGGRAVQLLISSGVRGAVFKAASLLFCSVPDRSPWLGGFVVPRRPQQAFFYLHVQLGGMPALPCNETSTTEAERAAQKQSLARSESGRGSSPGPFEAPRSQSSIQRLVWPQIRSCEVFCSSDGFVCPIAAVFSSLRSSDGARPSHLEFPLFAADLGLYGTLKSLRVILRARRASGWRRRRV